MLTGNPIFPLAPGQSMVPGWPPDPSFSGTILRMLRLPWDLHFHGHDFSETVLIAPLGIVFVFFWPVWLFTRRPNRAERLCLGFAITAFLLWGWLSPLVRYAVPALAVFALLTGIRLARFWRTSPLITRASLAAACLWVLIPAICASMIVEINAPQLRYVAGAIGRDEYLNQALITYPSLAWLRDHTMPPNAFWVWRIAPTSTRRRSRATNPTAPSAPGPRPRSRANCARHRFDWLVAPPGDREADLAAARATGRVAQEMYRDPTS